MKIDRRDFFKFAAASGIAIPSWGLIQNANAQTPYTGKILIRVLMDGGVASDYWTDPKNDPTVSAWRTPVGGVTPEPVVVGGLRMAPRGGNAAFLAAYAPHMMFINGCNMRTNDHGTGKRVAATGSLGMGFPQMSALFADKYGVGMPFRWMASANAEFTQNGGLSPATPVPNANTLITLANPNAVSVTNDQMKQADIDKVIAAQSARALAINTRVDAIPRANILSKQFLASSDSRALLARVATFIPAQFNQQFPQVHAAMIAAQAGITSSFVVSFGGFDNHDNIENNFPNNGLRVTNAVDFIFQTAAAMGIDNRVVVNIVSDFGRTPMNNGNGKDHWGPGGTCVIMERNAPWAGRAFGATGPRLQGQLINPATGQVDPVNGKMITPAHIHDALRTYLGIQTADPRFQLGVPANEKFDFFNPAVQTGYPTV